MTPQQERKFDAKAEKHFRSHRELPNGRNHRFFNRDRNSEDTNAFKKNFDTIFPNSPGVGF